VHAKALKARLESGEVFTLVDVRSKEDFEQARLPKSRHIYIGEVPARLDAIDRSITTFCGSGQRAIIAASILKQNGFENVEVCLGSMAACSPIGCPMEKG
jgi:hydroxyacylglutathione hydrolase